MSLLVASAPAEASVGEKVRTLVSAPVSLTKKAVSGVVPVANALLMPARVMGDALTMLLAESALMANKVTNKLDLTADVDAVLLMEFDARERN